jgi:hypothetical protein
MFTCSRPVWPPHVRLNEELSPSPSPDCIGKRRAMPRVFVVASGSASRDNRERRRTFAYENVRVGQRKSVLQRRPWRLDQP